MSFTLYFSHLLPLLQKNRWADFCRSIRHFSYPLEGCHRFRAKALSPAMAEK